MSRVHILRDYCISKSFLSMILKWIISSSVTGSTDDGMLEGVLRGVTGVFPPHCVQEVRLRNPQAVRESLIAPQVARVQGRREMMVPPHYGTAPRIRKP